jgi:hypothetical protein
MDAFVETGLEPGKEWLTYLWLRFLRLSLLQLGPQCSHGKSRTQLDN